ncbi:hypothetical protein PT974_01880 [Cladobotryum mycophilum]|uniref:Periplasmic copper-binding protein NosD beta helix domain-containing protein n=1 Tax=Cladobotryum mycophilum TaxID=491253 RepID=A0ABR0SXM6_9HYPO
MKSLLLCAIALLELVSAGGPPGRTVRAGGCIQSAIDAARPGDRIIVERGTYYEQLTISKNGIHLIGQKGAVIAPPKTPSTKPNGCTGLAGPGTVAGICIIGTNVKLANFEQEHRKVLSVGKYVKDVTVEGFEVRGFNGINIAIVGAQNAEVRGNTVTDGTAYGVLTAGSRSTLITRNTAKTSSILFIGICMDDQSDVEVSQNSISDYFIGLCVQTNRAEVVYNKVSNCCFGAFIDPGIKGAKVSHNTIGKTNPGCGGFGNGIMIGGAVNSEVSYNDITGINDQGNATNTAAGILIFDDPTSVSNGNVIEFNNLANNEQDILNVSKGKNTIKKNKCKTPGNLCK